MTDIEYMAKWIRITESIEQRVYGSYKAPDMLRLEREMWLSRGLKPYQTARLFKELKNTS